MEAGQFIPGVQFTCASHGGSLGSYRLIEIKRDQEDSFLMLEYINSIGIIDQNRLHVKKGRAGFRAWQYINHIYVESDLIRYKYLTIVP